VKRTKHSLSHYELSTFDMGQLIPVGNIEVLPGDSIRMSTAALIRLSPLVTPVMHPVSVRIHHWFVPYRILWEDWEDFITGGPDGLNAQYPPAAAVVNEEGSLLDYLGLPIDVPAGVPINLFPVRAYNMIWNDFYRDQDLQAERAVDRWADVANVAWEKDYFTSARPWVTKGNEVSLALGPAAPVKTQTNASVLGPQAPLKWADANSGADLAGDGTLGYNTAGQTIRNGADLGSSQGTAFPNNLYADLSLATAASINDLRRAFALQRYQEARALYGSRYTEYLRYLGVRSSDARLQRPEYLGGGKSTISFSEILRTGNESTAVNAPIGEMKGHGIAALRTRRFVRFFEEHGVVLSLASVRPRSIYSDGAHRAWMRRTKEDYWQKELEHIGQQPIYKAEVFANSAAPNEAFGYQDRYSEYRHHPSGIRAEFRSTLKDWHLARQFSAEPTLNAGFIECAPTKRVFAEQTGHSLWCMFQHSIQARRMVSRTGIGRIV